MGNDLANKEILGIYAAEGETSYYCVKKGLSGLKEISPGPGFSSSGKVAQGGVAGVRALLKDIKFSAKRDIFLALPRSLFFAREIKLPMMPVEDAIDSIKNSISIYSHLPVEEIYYDIAVTLSFNNSIRCLFLYAAKTIVDKYREIFRETGHFNSLVSIFPISYGVGAFLQQKKNIQYPAVVLLEYERDCEFSVFNDQYWLSSITWDAADKQNGMVAFKSLVARFPGIADNFYRVNISAGTDNYADNNNDFQEISFTGVQTGAETTGSETTVAETTGAETTGEERIDALSNNPALAAVSPALCKIQQISLDEKPVKVNFVKPLRYIVIIACIIAAVLFYVTANLSKDIKAKQLKMDKLKKTAALLEKKIQPVQERVKILQNAAGLKDDAELFLNSRPRLYTCVNEIARLVPDGTWFSSFRFRNGVITLRGYSKDALAAVKNLRKSKYFSKVSIKGSVVSRGGKDKEQFNLELTLKKK